MDDLRSSKQQLRDELDAMYDKMTDPNKREEEALKKKRVENINELKEDYGLVD